MMVYFNLLSCCVVQCPLVWITPPCDQMSTIMLFTLAIKGETHRVEGVILSGGRRYLGWITKFTLHYSMDKVNWQLAPTAKVVRVAWQ